MVEAALTAIDPNENKPPAELALHWQCLEYKTLPEAGGLFDQPARLIHTMRRLAFVYDAYRLFASMPTGQFQRKHPQHYQMWLWLERQNHE